MTGTALTPRDRLKAELYRFAPSYAHLLPKGYAADRLITGALVAVTLEPKLLDCSPVSIATALARVARWGLDVGETAHLIPFGKTCTPSADYKGLIRLMLRAGARKVEAHAVRETDQFSYQHGTTPMIQHLPSGDSKPITHAYAVAWFRNGETQFEVMTAAEIDAIRQSKSMSWKRGELTKWYARKTVVRQLAKWLDASPEIKAVVEQDEKPITEGDVPENLVGELSTTIPETTVEHITAGRREVRHDAYRDPEIYGDAEESGR